MADVASTTSAAKTGHLQRLSAQRRRAAVVTVFLRIASNRRHRLEALSRLDPSRAMRRRSAEAAGMGRFHFISGLPRSGSTLLAALLRHPTSEHAFESGLQNT
jgi:hypothetical protein